MPRLFSDVFFSLLLTVSAAHAAPVPVGRAHEMGDVLIPGPELRVKPVKGPLDKAVVRIKASYAHGTAGFRYDLVVIPLEAGTLNVADFLEPANGAAPAAALPPVTLEAEGVLPPGPPQMLTAPPPLNPDKTGGYSAALPWLGLVWVLLGGWLFWNTGKKRAAAAAAPEPELSPADRLRPLVESALARPLELREKAEMERLILVRERERLGLAGAADPAVWRALRADPAAAPWLSTLESWLHRPDGPPPAEADLRALLTSLHPGPALS